MHSVDLRDIYSFLVLQGMKAVRCSNYRLVSVQNRLGPVLFQLHYLSLKSPVESNEHFDNYKETHL